MILNFWIIPLYIVMQVGDAVGVGWDFVGSVSDDFLDFFVGYAFTTPLCLVSVIHHLCLALPPTLGEI